MKSFYKLQLDTSSFQNLFDNLSEILPKALGFIGFIILSLIFIKVVLYIIKKMLKKTKIDDWSKKLSETEIFGNSTVNIVLTKIILGIIKWLLILVFVMLGADIFGLDALSEGISSFIAYLPRLLTAVIIFAAGIYIGTIVKKAIHSMFKSLDITGGNLVGNIAFYLIVIFISITALDQAGVDTSVIKNNLTMILGSIVLSFTIAFGLGSRDVIKKLLFGFYSRKNFEVGQKIKVGNITGEIHAIDNICMTIITKSGKVILPIDKVVNKKVEIL